MKITGSKFVAVTGVPPVTPVVPLDSKLPPHVPKPFIKQPHTAAEQAGEPVPDVVLIGRLGKELPPIELYGPDGKMVGTPSASGTPRAK